MTAYYNEIDPNAAEWLRNLIKAGHIADGVVDGGTERRQGSGGSVTPAGVSGGLADADGAIPEQPAGEGARPREAESRRTLGQPDGRSAVSGSRPTGPTNGFWGTADWLFCRDGKWRPVEPGTFPLVDGAPARVVRLRAYGNAINAQAAKEFIASYMDVLERQI